MGRRTLYSGVAPDDAVRLGTYTAFFEIAEPRLRRALAAAYGPGIGRDACAEALSYAWQHWERVSVMTNPTGYLYRVGQTHARRLRRPFPYVHREEPPWERWVEPGLSPALRSLTEPQRVAVVLCHGFGWTHREVGELLGIAATTVQNHVERGLAKLRDSLEVASDA